MMVDRIVYRGEISEGMVETLKNPDPYNPETQGDKNMSKLLFSPLISNLVENKFDLRLAEKVEMTEDKTSYKVVLRKNIFFSNGKKITTDDVVFSLEKVNPNKNYFVEKKDDETLLFKINKDTKDNFVLLELFTNPILSKNDKLEENYNTKLVTSSTLRIKNFTQNTENKIESIALTRYDNGEEKLPYIKTLNVNFYASEAEAYNAFQRKKIDSVSGIPGNTISKIKDDTNVAFEVAKLPNNFSVFFNQNKNETLKDQAFRQALSDSLDRKNLVNQVLGGFGTAQKRIFEESNTVNNPAIQKTSQEIINTLKRNSEAGFLFENGVLYMSTKATTNSKDGAKKQEKVAVKIKITTIQNVELVETAKFIKNSWEKIGVQTDIQVIDKHDLNDFVKKRDFEGLLFGFSIKNSSDYYSFFSSKERNFPKLNISNYTNKDVDRILESLNTEANISKKKSLLENLSDEISTDNPILVLYKPQFVFAHYKNVNAKLPTTIKNEEDRYTFINEWYTNTEKVLSIFNKISFVKRIELLSN